MANYSQKVKDKHRGCKSNPGGGLEAETRGGGLWSGVFCGAVHVRMRSGREAI